MVRTKSGGNRAVSPDRNNLFAKSIMRAEITISSILEEARRLGIELYVDGERLRYRAPQGALNENLRIQITQHKEELLSFLSNRNGSVSSAQMIARRQKDGDERIVLSFGQERLWFLYQMDPANPLYNLNTAARLMGVPDIDALEHSINEIISRHEILRTRYQTIDGQPFGVVDSALKLTIEVTDLLRLSEPDREPEALRISAEYFQQPFDLGQGPLIRASVLKLGERNYLLLLSMHHIISDGWSIGILFRELAALYESYSARKRASLSELPLQYSDFAYWQRQWLQGEALKNHLTFWKDYLSGANTILDLHTDRPRPPAQSFRGARQSFRIPSDVVDSIKSLAQQERATLFAALLPAFQTLLYRYTNQEDITVGTPVANRNKVEIENLIGFFVNTVAMRVDLSGDPIFRQLLGRAREAILEVQTHQEIPFERVVEEVQPKRELNRAPLFQVMFVLQNAPLPRLKLADLTLVPMEIDNGTAKFDLTLYMRETGRELTGSLAYNTDLFESTSIDRMIARFQTLLKSIAADADQRISKLALITSTQRRQLLTEYNQTDEAYPRDRLIHQLFEAQAETIPDALAIVYEKQNLTYGKLNKKANQLAHCLKSMGVGPETPVGICMEPSIETIIGILGIIKAGGAYAPIDPSFPKERADFILNDTQAPVLLTQQTLLEKFLGCKAQVINVDAGWQTIMGYSDENPCSYAEPGNLIYIIFTSGSTGAPKGVAIEHRQLLNYIYAIRQRLQFPFPASYAMVSSIAADLGNTCVFPSLCFGGSLHIISPDRASDPNALAEYFQEHDIDCLKIVPSHLSALLTSARSEQVIPRKRLILGGESSGWSLIERLRSLAPHCSIFNHYGPTESTVGVLTCEVEDRLSDVSATVPCGRPIGNIKIYLLDQYFEPAPVGIPGEVHIGGLGLARGYFNRPELAAEKFIPNPFSREPGWRLYRAGDLARYGPSGNIEFLGRVDDQVKIHGFRIELGDVKAVLDQHPSIRESLVTTYEALGAKAVAAYIVFDDGNVTVAGLRDYMKKRLPEYMIPSAFVTLDSLPRLPNGKINRKALPAPDKTALEARTVYEPPASPVEKEIAGIWTRLLGVERIGARDSFFDLGGHSLLATQLVARIYDAFQVSIPLRSIFERPTIVELALVIEEELIREIAKHTEEEAASLLKEYL
jgi:amino acid adenylation domain-containing protein